MATSNDIARLMRTVESLSSRLESMEQRRSPGSDADFVSADGDRPRRTLLEAGRTAAAGASPRRRPTGTRPATEYEQQLIDEEEADARTRLSRDQVRSSLGLGGEFNESEGAAASLLSRRTSHIRDENILAHVLNVWILGKTTRWPGVVALEPTTLGALQRASLQFDDLVEEDEFELDIGARGTARLKSSRPKIINVSGLVKALRCNLQNTHQAIADAEAKARHSASGTALMNIFKYHAKLDRFLSRLPTHLSQCVGFPTGVQVAELACDSYTVMNLRVLVYLRFRLSKFIAAPEDFEPEEIDVEAWYSARREHVLILLYGMSKVTTAQNHTYANTVNPARATRESVEKLVSEHEKKISEYKKKITLLERKLRQQASNRKVDKGDKKGGNN